MTASHYWLAQWLDENEIHSEWEIDHALSSKSGVEGLTESVFRASQEIEEGRARYPSPNIFGDSIVAGSKIDLSGKVSCPSYGCMKEVIDTSFKRLWHYFDQIVVEGLAPHQLVYEIRNAATEDFPNIINRMREQARLLLYFREIGAERSVIFAPKTGALGDWRQNARDLGLAIIDESLDDRTILKVVESSTFNITEVGSDSPEWDIVVRGKYFTGPEYNNFHVRKAKTSGDPPPTPEQVTRWIIRRRAMEMTQDVSLAQHLSLPLVEPVNLPWISQPYPDGNKRRAEGDAVIRIALPVFNSLTTKDFLKLREDERPSFEIFRTELRKAVEGEIAQNSSNPPAVIAQSIQNEYLRPGLACIEQQVRSRRSALIKKTAVNLTIGTTAAAIGAITGMPLLVEGFAALGSAIPLAPIIHKYIDDGEPIKLDKFYFLWQAEKQAEHH
jgi:hypothetical protein